MPLAGDLAHVHIAIDSVDVPGAGVLPQVALVDRSCAAIPRNPGEIHLVCNAGIVVLVVQVVGNVAANFLCAQLAQFVHERHDCARGDAVLLKVPRPEQRLIVLGVAVEHPHFFPRLFSGLGDGIEVHAEPNPALDQIPAMGLELLILMDAASVSPIPGAKDYQCGVRYQLVIVDRGLIFGDVNNLLTALDRDRIGIFGALDRSILTMSE